MTVSTVGEELSLLFVCNSQSARPAVAKHQEASASPLDEKKKAWNARHTEEVVVEEEEEELDEELDRLEATVLWPVLLCTVSVHWLRWHGAKAVSHSKKRSEDGKDAESTERGVYGGHTCQFGGGDGTYG